MAYRSNDDSAAPGTRTKSYLGKIPTNNRRREQNYRRTSVKDSLVKFLDDCGNEDLIMNAASPQRKKNNRALSSSEHGPPSSSIYTTPKRRGKKPERLRSNNSNNKISSAANFSSPRRFGTKNDIMSLTRSEHGTPSTEKASLSSLNSNLEPKLNEGSLSDDGSFAADVVEPLNNNDSPARSGRSSSSRRNGRSASRSTRKDQTRRSKSTSSSTRIRRTTSEREKSRGPRSERIRKGNDVRRTKSENVTAVNLGDHFADAADSTTDGCRRRSTQDDDNRSVSSSRSSFSTVNSRTGKSLGLDAGPLNGFLNTERQVSMVGSSSASVGPGIAPSRSNSQSESYLRLRRERQDEILSQAQRDRWNAKKEKSKVGDPDDIHASLHDGIPDGEDDDQPKVKNKNTAYRRFRKGISKTGRVTRNTAKGTVNVVRDPKRAAKKMGGFAKDVGKETAQMMLNPKLAAKTAVSLGRDVTKGTYKVTKGVGKGVAKGSLGFKTMAKTGVNATTMVVGTAWDGAGKVVHGATGLIFKHGNGESAEEYAEYKASEMESRRKTGMSLMDRVSSNASNTSSAASEEDKLARAPRMNISSIPTVLVDNHTKQSWDF